MNHPVEGEPFAPPVRGCGCVLIAVTAGVIAGALLLEGVLGDCFEDAACRARKASAWVWLTPILVLVLGVAIGAIFLRVMARRD